MNKIKTTRSLLSAVIVAAAFGLVACGGGGDNDSLPAGMVGTIGDGVNAAEFAAIQCGMNKDQVMAIIGDAPTVISGETLWTWATVTDGTQIAFTAADGVVKYKGTGKRGNPPSEKVTC